MKISALLFSAAVGLFLTTGCYSFKGISINPNANTFYVARFEDVVNDEVPPPADLNIIFTERLKDKIRAETRLNYKEVDPDLEFSGKITGFRVTAEAPQQGEVTSFNRLTISISVEYLDHKGTDEEPLKSNFKFFKDFSTDENLLSIQDDLIDDINEELVEMIFNWAFTNW